ncbi:MAG: outer membrane protein assembly factor, partial [Phycisphaerae bacterium]
TQLQRYRVTFEEPYLFDSPYSFSNDIYFFTRARESYDERRIGDVVTLGRRFGDVWSTFVAFRGEDVTISNVTNSGPSDWENITRLTDEFGNVYYQGSSAQEILDNNGSHLLTSIKPGIVRDTTDSRIFPTTGSRSSLSWEQYGAVGGDVNMSKITGRFDWYYPLYTDIFDRKTVLAQRNEVGLIPAGDSVFYERFYGGGIGSLRGFKFRGISPRSGPLQDPVGGDFSWLSTVEVNYPIFEEIVRGVVFTDVGTVERDIQINQVRSDIGTGLRLTIPFFGQLPLAVDFAVPVTKAPGDRKQLISFSLGIPF